MGARYVHHEKPANGGFLCYIKESDGKLRVTVIKLTHARDQANGESSGLRKCPAQYFSRLLVSFSLQGLTLKAYFVPFYNNR